MVDVQKGKETIETGQVQGDVARRLTTYQHFYQSDREVDDCVADLPETVIESLDRLGQSKLKFLNLNFKL